MGSVLHLGPSAPAAELQPSVPVSVGSYTIMEGGLRARVRLPTLPGASLLAPAVEGL